MNLIEVRWSLAIGFNIVPIGHPLRIGRWQLNNARTDVFFTSCYGQLRSLQLLSIKWEFHRSFKLLDKDRGPLQGRGNVVFLRSGSGLA